ncbi:hypothetical protein OESDEN_03025 [Oesophagostomum dentatum]|uniref:Uncharacterized protein n=1 Tax=Oesophagostomum dentatum TaxID=61180 RepID=A0A0B1TNM2_OESDE|nr:hypothetical protein OESDEN_03025 [Oesophagostomum dentatum]
MTTCLNIVIEPECMDQKWKYDLATLLRVHKPLYINVTCKGSDNGFVAYQHALSSRFLQQQIVWKKCVHIFYVASV